VEATRTPEVYIIRLLPESGHSNVADVVFDVRPGVIKSQFVMNPSIIEPGKLPYTGNALPLQSLEPPKWLLANDALVRIGTSRPALNIGDARLDVKFERL